MLHQLVPQHEVGGRGILVDQKHPASGLPALDDPGRLGGAAAGVRRGEAAGILFIGQVVDEQGNVHVVDAAPILGPQFEGRIVRDHILPAVPGNVVVDAQLQGLEQRGFPVVTAAHDQRDSLLDPHSGDPSPVGQLHLHPQALRRGKRYPALHGAAGNAALPGQHRAVRHKGDQAPALKLLPDELLVLRQLRHRLYLLRIPAGVEKYALYAAGQEFKEDFDQLPGVDGPPEGREAHLKTGGDARLCDLACRPGENLRSGTADGDQAALARALGLEVELGDLPPELPDQIVLQRRFLPGRVKISPGVTGPGVGHRDAHLGGGGEGVPLYVVDGQGIALKRVNPLGRFISRIAFPVDGFQ